MFLFGRTMSERVVIVEKRKEITAYTDQKSKSVNPTGTKMRRG
jgi:hypothetical protein